jgi:ArsR family metal-binding transcriptional regulator
MANKFQVEIQETVEELEHRLERAITAVSKKNVTAHRNCVAVSPTVAPSLPGSKCSKGFSQSDKNRV